MRRHWAYALAAGLAIGITACEGEKDLNEEIDDVVEAQEEAARQVAEDPMDTAEARRKAEQVIEEQRDVQRVLPESAAARNVPRTVPSTTTQQ